MQLLELSDFGLLTVEEAAKVRGCNPSTVRRWANRGEIPVLQVGTGRNAKFLLRKSDVDGFIPKPVGAPTGNVNAKKEPKKQGAPKKRSPKK